MSRVLTNEQNYYDIADTIRQMKEVNTTYKPRQMASALKDIYSNEVEGTLPLNFQANGNNLLNYRIDGASGGVGDRTSNLFDKKNTEIIHAYFSPENLWQVNEDSSSIIIKVRPNTQYTLSIGRAISIFRIYKTSLENPEPGKSNVFTPIIRSSNIKTYTFTTDNDITYIIFQGTNADTEMWINSLILNIGSTSLPSYEPYGYKIPVVVTGKNLFDELQVVDTTASTEISNYQIFKQNEKLIINGLTTSSQADVEISKTNGINNQALDFINNNANYYVFSSTVPGKIMIRYKINGSDVVRYTFDEYNSSNKVADRIVFRLQPNYQYNNEQMNIMFKLKQIQSDNYEPYIEPTTTNIYLDEPIEENESISLSDTEVDIPTIEGTNTLTIDTTIQPSNVYIQAPKDTPKMIEARERLEVI